MQLSNNNDPNILNLASNNSADDLQEVLNTNMTSAKNMKNKRHQPTTNTNNNTVASSSPFLHSCRFGEGYESVKSLIKIHNQRVMSQQKLNPFKSTDIGKEIINKPNEQ